MNKNNDNKNNNGAGNLLLFSVLTLLVGLLYSTTKKKSKVTRESNCNELLQRFNKLIDIPQEKVNNLMSAHETIRNKIRTYFYNSTNLPVPDFFIQGSYKMKTIVENRNMKCDVDLGVIFPEDPRIKFETLQQHIKNALWNHTIKGVIIKKTCVRLTYVRDFHIDLPIYFKGRNGIVYYGSRSNQWQQSDPKKFVLWFNKKTSSRPQLLRIIRYLKAWADYTRTKKNIIFPSGLALTIWAIDHYEYSSRDDLSLFYTCSRIIKYLNDNFQSQWEAKMPVAPFDNVLNRLSGSHKSAFYEELKGTVSLMVDAVSAQNQDKARLKWNKIFGNRFKNLK